MKKLFVLLLAVMMVMALVCACGDEKDPADTKDTTPVDTKAPDTKAPDTQAPETQTPDTQAPETTDPLEEDLDLPKQEDVPCNFDEVYDLSESFTLADGLIEMDAALWFLGDDNTPMATPLTVDLLKEYKYFAFTYDTDYCEETNRFCIVFKITHNAGQENQTKTEYLCKNWYPYGPTGDNGNTEYASSFMQMPVYGPHGVLYVETSKFLDCEWFDAEAGDVIDQMGICSVEDTNTLVYVEVTGAYLTK